MQPSAYTIAQGDTLSKIAAANNTSVASLAALNNISDPNKIVAGASLKLPSQGSSPVYTPSIPKTPVSTPSSSYINASDSQQNSDNEVNNNIKALTTRSEALTKRAKERFEESSSLLSSYITQLGEMGGIDAAGINQEFASARGKLESEQKKETAATSTKLARMGGYLGGTGSQVAYLNSLAESQRMQLQDLDSKRLAALRKAQQASIDRNFQVAQAEIKLANDYEDQIYKLEDDFNTAVRQVKTDDVNSKKAALDRTKTVSEQIAPAVATYLTGNPENDNAIITTYASQNGIDPAVLQSAVIEHNRKSQKDLPALIQEYNEVSDRGWFNGTFLEYQQQRGSSGAPKSRLLSLKDATKLGLPQLAGVTEDEIIRSSIDSKGKVLSDPPAWYVDLIQTQSNMNLKPEVIQKSWDELKPSLSNFTQGTKEESVEDMINNYY